MARHSEHDALRALTDTAKLRAIDVMHGEIKRHKTPADRPAPLECERCGRGMHKGTTHICNAFGVNL